jgi:hypothetical protein
MEEFKELKVELEQLSGVTVYSPVKAVKRAKKSRRRAAILKTPSIFFASLAAAFVIAVNLFPAVALAMSDIPALKELVRAVALDKSLKAAVDHEYYQAIGVSRTQEDVTVTVDYMILDSTHISLFFRVDAPVKEGTWNYKFRDANGNELTAFITADSVYEPGKTEEVSLDFIHAEEMPEDFTFTVTVNADGNLNLSEASLPTEKTGGEAGAGNYTFSFQLHPDSQYIKAKATIIIDRWIEVMEQRIYLKSLDIYPTQSILHLDYDDKNSAVIDGLEVTFEDEKGNMYGVPTGDGVTAWSEGEDQGALALYYESSYFSDSSDLTLYINGIRMKDKDKLYGEIDYSRKTITNMPEGVSVDSMTMEDTTLVVVIKNASERPNSFQQVIPFEYYDTEGNCYSTDFNMAAKPEDKSTLYTTLRIKNYEEHRYKVKWIYTPVQSLDIPVTVQIK